MAELQIGAWSPADDAVGVQLLASWERMPAGRWAPPADPGAIWRAIVALQLRADALAAAALGDATVADLSAIGSPAIIDRLELGTTELGGRAADDAAIGLEWQLAIRHVLRVMASAYRRIEGEPELPPPSPIPGLELPALPAPEDLNWGPRPPGWPPSFPWPPIGASAELALFPTLPAALPLLGIAAIVLGVAAIAATAYVVVEEKRSDAQVESEAASGMWQAFRDINIALAQIGAGQTPAVPSWVPRAADQERAQTHPLLWAGAGAGVAAVALIGAKALKDRAMRSNPRRYHRSAPRPNPRRRRKRLIRSHKRSSPKCKKCGRAHTTSAHWSHARAPRGGRKGAYAKKRNPLKSGYSRQTVGANIATMRREGKSAGVASAAAYRSARADFKRRHPGKALPAHLRQKNPSAAGTRITVQTVAASAKKKKNPKKKKAKKKNAPRVDRFGRPLGKSPRAKFIRGQMAKGRSKAQAVADYKARQRLRRMRRKR